MANFWQIPNNITLWAWESIRRKWDDSWFEAYNPMSGWDMLKSTYDPTNVNWDAFDQDNMVSWTVNKNFTATEQTKLAELWTAWPITTFSVTNNNDWTATISTCDVVLNNATDYSWNYDTYTITWDTFTFTDWAEEYIVADYNSWSPIFRKETDKTLINGSSIVTMAVCWRVWTFVHQANEDWYGLGLANKINRAMYNTNPYRRSIDWGLIIWEITSPNPRTITLSSGIVYTGSYPQLVVAFNSSTQTMTEVYHVAWVWTYTNRLVYGNQSYDNWTAKVTMDLNKYACRWFYRSIWDDAQVFYVNWTTQYNTSAAAALEQPRTDLPIVLRDHCMLVGRSIIQLNATSWVTDSAFNLTFNWSTVINHNDTNNIQGGTTWEYYHLTATEHWQVQNGPTYSKEWTWFTNPELITVTWDNSTRTVTLTQSGWVTYMYRSILTTLTSPWTSSAHWTDTAQTYFLSSSDWVNFTWSTSPFNYYDIQVARARYINGGWVYFRECHGLMQWQSHIENHNTIWTYLLSGWDLSNYTLASATLKYPNTSTANIYDEDLPTANASNTSWTYTQHYISWSWATSNFVTWASAIVPVSWDQPYYNQFTGWSWQQTLVTDSNYMCVWQIAIPMASDTTSQAYRFVWIQWQETWTLTQMQARTSWSLNLWSLSSIAQELVFINKVIIRYIGWNWSITQVDKLTGSKVSQTSAPAWNYLSSVTTDSTLTGSWTATDPLWINPSWNPQVATIELWHASDTTLSRVSAWVIAVEWVTIPTISSDSTLTNKTFDDEFRAKQIATPSNPSAWYNKLYFKSDDKLYKLTSAWVETEIWAWWGWLTWWASISWSSWVWLSLTASSGATGGYSMTISDSSTAPTNAWNYSVLWNTQSVAHIMWKTDTWTSAQANTWHLYKVYNASSNAKAIEIDPSTTCTWIWIRFINYWWSGFRWIYWISVSGWAWTYYWIRQLTINGSSWTAYWISQDTVNDSSWTWYWLYQWVIQNFNSWTAYWIYQSNISAWTWTAIWRNASLTNNASNISAKFFNLVGSISWTLLSRTTDMCSIDNARIHQWASTITDNFNQLYIKRTNRTNNASSTFNAQWSVLKLENVATQTSWTLTDTVDVIQVTQWASSTWNPISITQWAVVSTNFRRIMKETNTWITLWISNGTTANWNLSWTAWDICLNAGSNKPEYCTWTTNWTALV